MVFFVFSVPCDRWQGWWIQKFLKISILMLLRPLRRDSSGLTNRFTDMSSTSLEFAYFLLPLRDVHVCIAGKKGENMRTAWSSFHIAASQGHLCRGVVKSAGVVFVSKKPPFAPEKKYAGWFAEEMRQLKACLALPDVFQCQSLKFRLFYLQKL